MKTGPVLANVAALIGDPARANMLEALMSGQALTATELAEAAGVTAQTASSHLAQLTDGRLLLVEKQGRHRYFRLSGPDVAHTIEALMGLAHRTGARRVRTGPQEKGLRTARTCYDHLAGERGVEMLEGARRRGLITGEKDLRLTARGWRVFNEFGIDLKALDQGRRPICRPCLDWSERRIHLAGGLGAGLLAAFLERGWVRRGEGRVLLFTPSGLNAFRSVFGLTG